MNPLFAIGGMFLVAGLVMARGYRDVSIHRTPRPEVDNTRQQYVVGNWFIGLTVALVVCSLVVWAVK